MRRLLTSIVLAAGLASPAMAEAPDRLVTVVTSDQPQVQLMSMVLTNQAMARGHAAHVLLCGAAGDMALRDAPEAVTAGQPPQGASPQGLLRMAMEKGATVEVCALYLPGRGADVSVLIEGVGVAKPPAMAEALTAEGTLVWSF